MKKRLFFVCPSDFMEPVINKVFKGDNYFLTSLGNSVYFDGSLIMEIINLIENEGVKEIKFILSDDNKIFQDAYGDKKFAVLTGLESFYGDVACQMKQPVQQWHMKYSGALTIPNHLNKKIEELRSNLCDRNLAEVKIDYKIFNRQRQKFITRRNNLYKQMMSLN